MSSSSLQGKSICFSGTLSSRTRAEATQVAKAHGATVKSSITNNLDILVAAPGAGGKVATAESKGVTVWTEEEFNAAVGQKTPAAAASPTLPAKKKAPPRKKGAAASPESIPEEEAMEDAESAPTKRARGAAKKKAATVPETPPPAKKQRAAATPKTPTAAAVGKKKTSTIAPATPAVVPGQRRVMSAHASRAGELTVYEDYDVKLMLSDSLHANSNKFYKLQLLVSKTNDDHFYVATNWGRLGEPGQSQCKGPHNREKGIAEFCKVFRSKTRNSWGANPFVRHGDKYQIVETMEGGGGEDENSDDAALGRLTESQINKGQEVLQQIRQVLSAKRKTPRDATALGELSNEFYSLIPTKSGRQRPPRLDNLDIVTEKEGLLEFWLRMGFEDVHNVDTIGSPIEGMMELPVPPTLSAAAKNIADKHSIDSSRNRGKELSSKKAGNPVKTMGPELYGAILLYTGNSIYRELNRCLRLDWKSVPKYWNYLRLYSEAMNAIPVRQVTLWRGIAADLWDEYQVGKVITWWSISSCTASKAVAENFMNQLGGSAATFLTLHTKTACDISALSFYPHEQESLLRPGTKLKVLSRSKKGKVAYIELEEIIDEEVDGKTEEK